MGRAEAVVWMGATGASGVMGHVGAIVWTGVTYTDAYIIIVVTYIFGLLRNVGL